MEQERQAPTGYVLEKVIYNKTKIKEQNYIQQGVYPFDNCREVLFVLHG